ncbi:MAG: hypothetical protein QGH06_05280 [Lutibacter sp.]|jgi:hypothetical protein|nr:hypothetical protein [Lutibacter sp.]
MKRFSTLVSYVFHPVNFPLTGSILYFISLPSYLLKVQEYTLLTGIFIGAYLIPLLFFFLLRRFGVIRHFHLASLEERKFPTLLFITIACMMGHWLHRIGMVDGLALYFYGYGASLMVIYLLLHLKCKASLHLLAISGLLGFLLCHSLTYRLNLLLPIALLFSIMGLVARARLVLGVHNLKELWIGFLTGIIPQFIAYFFYSI